MNISLPTIPTETTTCLDLSGRWEFSLGDTPDFTGTINLPGSLQAQGFGDEVSTETEWTARLVDRAWYTSERYARYRETGNIKVPFWLQPERHYLGAAWFRREIEIPADWQGKRIVLTLERAHIETTVWLDGQKIGSQYSLGAPHLHDLSVNILPGKHELSICVNNRMPVDVGLDSHSVSDHTQTNWNGIIGRMELRATSLVWIDDAQVYPDISSRSVKVRVRIGNSTGEAGEGRLRIGPVTTQVHWNASGGMAEVLVPLGPDAQLWDEFSPALHRLTLNLSGNGADDEREISFGLREVGIEGTQMTVNGRKIFLRGTLECAVYPLTGYPPTGISEWRRVLGTIKDYGFNHVRFHSWCPPEAAFAVADELGLYLQVECSSWATTTTSLGEGKPLDDWLYEEARAIIREFGNHPSFLLMAYGNEPSGNYAEYLAKWLSYWKVEDPRRLHTGGAGWPALAENHFDNITEPRIQVWGERRTSCINVLPPSTDSDYETFVRETPRPIVSHEIGQWCAYPDFSEIPKYTGLLKAKNYEIFRESLDEHHMGDQARDFLMASGKLQVLCYREDIEAALRTKGFGGFQILGASDFPGQGTAPVGWLNAFWENKGYATPEEFRRFNNPIVLLARLEKRIFGSRGTLRAEVEAACFEAEPLADARPVWKLVDERGAIHASGRLPTKTLTVDNGIQLGRIEVSLDNLPAPAKYRLVIGLEETSVENDWEIWVYPENSSARSAPGVAIVRDWEVLLKFAEKESKVLFLPPAGAFRDSVALGFSPIFWNTSWTMRHPPLTLGILCDPAHPLFGKFPTESHSNWQWWELFQGASALSLDPLPSGLRPIVQLIDDWVTNRRLGLLFEARLGKCRVVVSGIELLGAMHVRHAARQFRRSVLDYMAGVAFDPEYELDQVALGQTLGHQNAAGPEPLPIMGEGAL